MDLLRFLTAGSVDDGKSTLIGRLLHDSGNILDDQMEAIKKANRKNDDGTLDLAILTDGLKSEREQGITIDVAYKYFSTPLRKFIIADTPGHIEYTRNMVTGASNCDLSLILVDARKGLLEQTFRHTYIASLLGIRHIVVCVNKMDMVNYEQNVFDDIVKDFDRISSKIDVESIHFIPLSALKGDNIVHYSQRMNWYQGPALLDILEHTEIIRKDEVSVNASFPVQWVIRPQTDALHDYRGYAGRIAGGFFKKGDAVTILPSGVKTTVKSIDTLEGELEEAVASQSVTMLLNGDADISRGDTIVKLQEAPLLATEFEADLCWMSGELLNQQTKFILQHNSKTTICRITEILYKVDVNTLDQDHDDRNIGANDICHVRIKAANPLFLERYEDNRLNGAAILIHPITKVTVGALMVRKV